MSEKLLLWLITQVVANISEPLRNFLQQMVAQLENTANQTPNPWDNILVMLLKAILGQANPSAAVKK